MRDQPAEKWLRDAKVFQIVEGTSEIQRQIVTTYLAHGGLGEGHTRG
jgi:alkylation response protein AidB-like acyl-CoA dehydrogenase